MLFEIKLKHMFDISLEATESEMNSHPDIVMKSVEQVPQVLETIFKNKPEYISISKDSPDFQDLRKSVDEQIKRINKKRETLNRLNKINQDQLSDKEIDQICECCKDDNPKESRNQEQYIPSKKRYARVLYEIHKDPGMILHIKRICDNGNLIQKVADCIQRRQLTSEVKRILKILLSEMLAVPDFVLTNLGKDYEDSWDYNNDKLWGYLRTILRELQDIPSKPIGCIEMAKRICRHLQLIIQIL